MTINQAPSSEDRVKLVHKLGIGWSYHGSGSINRLTDWAKRDRYPVEHNGKVTPILSLSQSALCFSLMNS